MTSLSTGAIRNDLIASYLGAPGYSSCNRPFSLAACTPPLRSATNACGYRDYSLCSAREKVSEDIRDLYEGALKRLADGQNNESRVWALQNIAEVQSENSIDGEPELAYNIAHLLLTLNEPSLAYRYISGVTERPELQAQLSESMQRLAFVTSIFAGEEPTGLARRAAENEQPTALRAAYTSLYPPDRKTTPAPFSPLVLDDRTKTEVLDAWLFVRRYRALLASGDFDGFSAEYERLVALDEPMAFLPAWKQQVSAAYIRRAMEVRKEASPEAADQIDRFLAREDLFSDEEFADAGAARPFFLAKFRWLGYAALGLVVLAIGLLLGWLSIAFRRTFISSFDPSVGSGGGPART